MFCRCTRQARTKCFILHTDEKLYPNAFYNVHGKITIATRFLWLVYESLFPADLVRNYTQAQCMTRIYSTY